MNDYNHTTQHHHDQAKKYPQLVVSQYVEILRIQSYNTYKKNDDIKLLTWLKGNQVA